MWKKRHLERFRSGFTEKTVTDSRPEFTKYTACNVCCTETLVSDKVLRVKLEQFDFKKYFSERQKKEDKPNYNGVHKNAVRLHNFKKKRKYTTSVNKRRFTRSSATAEEILPGKRVPKVNLKHLDFVSTTAKKTDTLKLSGKRVPKNTLKFSEKRVPKANLKHLDFVSTTARKINALKKTTPSQGGDRRKKVNSNTMETLGDNNTQTMYVLTFNMWKRGRPKKLKREIEFPMLVKELKQINMPNEDWKIEIIITNKVINQVVFVNKTCDRCVKFYRQNSSIDIMMGDSKVCLIGAPQSLQTLEDVAVLLNIVHFIKEDDPIVKYENY